MDKAETVSPRGSEGGSGLEHVVDNRVDAERAAVSPRGSEGSGLKQAAGLPETTGVVVP